MSLTCDELRKAISSRDGQEIVRVLEPRVIAGETTEAESLLCGIVLLMPPIADYAAAARIFAKVIKGSRRLEAAVWDAYRFAVLMPVGSQSFEEVLKENKNSAIAAHMRSMVAAANSDLSLALEESRLSRSLRVFPFNAIYGLKNDFDLVIDEKIDLWRSINDLVVSKSAELDAAPLTVEGVLQSYWENLIVGTRVTSYLWDDYCRMFNDYYWLQY